MIAGDVITIHFVTDTETLGDEAGEYFTSQDGDVWHFWFTGSYSEDCFDYIEQLFLSAEVVSDSNSLVVSAVQDTISVQSVGTELQVFASDKDEPGFDPNFTIDLSLSNPTLGSFTLTEIDEQGFENVVISDTVVLSQVPYDALDPGVRPTGTGAQFVYFVPGDTTAASNKQLGFSPAGEYATVQVNAVRSDNASVSGSGTIVILDEPRIKFLVVNENGDLEDATHLVISNWEKAYEDLTGTFQVKNSLDTLDNFIDLDSAKFFIEIEDSMRNSTGSKDNIYAKIGTSSLQGVDSLTVVELTETGNETGVFRSKSQLLTAPDFFITDEGLNDHQYPDDLFEVNDGITGAVVADDSTNDRTHWTEVGGIVNVEYTTSGSNPELLRTQVSVCDEIKVIKYQAVTFLEPFLDEGIAGEIDPETGDLYGKGNGVFDCLGDCDNHMPGVASEPYINFSRGNENSYYRYLFDDDENYPVSYREDRGENFNSTVPSHYGRGTMITENIIEHYMEKTGNAWASGCFKFEKQEDTHVMNTPEGFLFEEDIFLDRVLNYDPDYLFIADDAKRVFSAYQDSMGMSSDIVYMFFGPNILSKRGEEKWVEAVSIAPYTDYAESDRYTDGELSYFFVGAFFHPATVAHEFGHMLTRQALHSHYPDYKDKPYIVFPEFPHESFLFKYDYQVNTLRRIPAPVLDLAGDNPSLIHGQ